MVLGSVELTFSEQITPYMPLIVAVVGALIVGGFGLWNRRRGAVETRAPDVNEMWAKQERDARALDTERAHRRHVENVLVSVLRAFRGYVRRVVSGGSVELTESERAAHDVEIPPMPGAG